MKRIRSAVIGCGYQGTSLIRNLNALEQCDLRVICDLEQERLAKVGLNWPSVKISTNAKAVCTDPTIDAVVICTPSHTHYGLASMALAAGKHVLVEKPLTHSVETAERLVEQAKQKGRVLHVDHTFIHSGSVREIGSIISRDSFGDLLYFDGVFVNLGMFQPDVNVVWDLAPHCISMTNFLIDDRPSWVSAIGCAHYGEFENIAYVTIGYSDSLLAHFHLSWLSPVKRRSILIGGAKRMIYYDDLEPNEKVRVYNKGVTLNGDDRCPTGAPVAYRDGDMYAPSIDKTEPLARVCSAFIDAILDKPRPESDGHAGLEVVRILEAAQKSINLHGERIKL